MRMLFPLRIYLSDGRQFNVDSIEAAQAWGDLMTPDTRARVKAIADGDDTGEDLPVPDPEPAPEPEPDPAPDPEVLNA